MDGQRERENGFQKWKHFVTIYFLDNFKKVLSATTLCKAVSFDFDCTFIKQYFGYDKSHQLDYYEFSQLVQASKTQ